MRATAIATILITLLAQVPTPAQEAPAKPWEDWRPPEVRMPEPNAWEIYLRGFDIHDEIRQRLEDEFPEGARVTLDMTEESLEPETLERLLDEYAPVFSALEAAIAGQAQAPPLRTHADLEAHLAGFGAMRQFARMLASRSVYHLRHGNALSAALDGIAIVRVAADVGTGGSLLAGLTQAACISIGESRLRDAIPHLGAEEAWIVANALREAMAQMATLANIIEGESICNRAEFIATIAPTMPTRAELERALEGQDVPEDAVTADETWEALNTWYETALAEARTPWWQREKLPTPENPLVATLTPALEQAGRGSAILSARLRVALTALAAQAYRADAGHYPATLDALVPDYLPEVPRDPFVDAPLRTIARDPISRHHPASRQPPGGARELTIYSVGPDGVDDGGVDMGYRLDDAKGDIALTLGTEQAR